MKQLLLILVTLILTGCEISPFVTEAMLDARLDVDGDGVPFTEDCDDDDRDVGRIGWYRDVDGDEFGAGAIEYNCDQPEGSVANDQDCDDTDESVNPSATELGCDEVDNDCDGIVDDVNFTRWYEDADEDTFGNPDSTLEQCEEPDGYVGNNQDCDDTESAVNPDATEICDDGIDQDCNGIMDDAEGAVAWWADADMDGFGDPDSTTHACAQPEEHVLNSDDCDDTDIDVNPDANEACGDGIDNDCNGVIDTDAVNVDWYRDADEDGYGNPNITTLDCAPPDGYVGNAEDCDDSESAVNPEVEEVCNDGIDNNCDEDPNDCVLSGTINLADADAKWEGLQNTQIASGILADCDLNGDSINDLIFAGSEDVSADAAVWVVFGPTSTGTMSASTADISVALDDDASSHSVACADLNGDGADDLVIGSPGDDTIASEAGLVFILLGPLSAGDYDISDVDFIWAAESASNLAGYALLIGDTNGDTVNDLIVSAYGAGTVYILHGPITTGGDLADADLRLSGSASLGFAMSLEDINDDGENDLLLGAPHHSSYNGAVYINYGPLLLDIVVSASDAIIWGQDGEWSGYDLTTGDIDGDGSKDVIVGAFNSDDTAPESGITYLFTTALSGELTTADATFALSSAIAYSNSGISVASGDLNQDGVDDLAIGAHQESSGVGGVYVIYGPITASGELSAVAHAHLTGESGSNFAGWNTAITPDMDGDTFGELFISAPSNSSGASGAGALYRINGLGY